MLVGARAAAIALVTVLLAVAGCSDEPDVGPNDPGERRGPTEGGASRTVSVAATPLLRPLALRAAESVQRPPGVDVQVTRADSDEALARLCAGDADVALTTGRLNAAGQRTCAANDVRPLRSTVGFQTVVLYAGEALDIDCLTLDQLRRLWRPGSEVERYSQLGDGLPDRPAELLGFAPESAAYELFARVVTGSDGPLREGVDVVRDRLEFADRLAATPDALAFGPVDLVEERPPELATVALDGGSGCVAPSDANVRARSYPIAPPVHMYVSRDALKRVPVERFVDVVLDEPGRVADYPGIVPVTDSERPEAEPVR